MQINLIVFSERDCKVHLLLGVGGRPSATMLSDSIGGKNKSALAKEPCANQRVVTSARASEMTG